MRRNVTESKLNARTTSGFLIFVVGRTDEVGVTLPPLHPRCRCVIIYRESSRSTTSKPRVVPRAGENKPASFNSDPQRFGGQKIPEGNYNLTLRRQVQNRHIEGTREFQDYAAKLSPKNLMPSKLSPNVDAQALAKEFHGKGVYDPNPKDNSPREQVDTGKIIGQYWDNAARKYVDTAWIEIVYSKRGTHIYPIRPPRED